MSLLDASSEFPFVILTGGLGTGKSTVVRRLLPQSLEEIPTRLSIVPAHARLTANGYLSEVASTLRLGKPRLLKEFGLTPAIQHQSVGSISQSESLRVNQSAASAFVDLPGEVGFADVPGVIRGFAADSSDFLLLIVDQAEQLVLGDKANALDLLDALARSVVRGKIGAVVVLREDFMSDIMPLAGAHPAVIKHIVRVPGFSIQEAEELIRKGSERSEVRFTNGLVRRLLERTTGSDGRIWPIALHAVCRQVTSLAQGSRRRVAVSDLERLGNIEGALSHAIGEVLAVLSPADRSEAVFLLYTISRVAGQIGTPAIDDLKRALPNYPEDTLGRLVDALIALHLLDRRPGGRLAFSHDAVGGAVHMLLGKKADEIEQAIDKWSRQGRALEASLSEGEIDEVLDEKDLPIAHIMFLAETVYFNSPGGSGSIDPRFQIHLHSKPSRDVAAFVRKRALHLSRKGDLRPEHFFILLLDDRPDSLAVTVAAMANEFADREWDLIGLERALRLARPCHLGTALSANDYRDLKALPQRCLRILADFFTLNPELAEVELVGRIWDAADASIRPAIFGLLSARSPDLAWERAIECRGHPSPSLRAAAFEILARLREGTGYLVGGIADVSPIVRRRIAATIAQSDHPELVQFLGQLARDASPLVREAVVEGVGAARRTECAALVIAALDDDYDFVRESAVYALKDVLDREMAGNLARRRLGDESAKVREAAYRLMATIDIAVAPDSLIADLRDDDISVAIAAIELSAKAMSADIDAALLELLCNARTPAPVAAAAIAVAGKYLPQEVVEVAYDLIFAEDLDLAMNAILALQRLAPPGAARVLGKLITHANVDVRERVVYALGELGGEEAVAGLRRALFDISAAIVARAIYGLARLNDLGAAELVGAVPARTEEVARAKEYFNRRRTEASKMA